MKKEKQMKKHTMGKIFLFTAVAMILAAAPALADWTVTVSNWTKSAGPELAYEEVQLNGQVKCTVAANDPANCNFTVDNLSNQEVRIVSYNTQGTGNPGYIVGALVPMCAPASGGQLNIIWVPAQ
jgi:hypothetical protein